MRLFPLYFPGNMLKDPSECTILKVVLKIVLGGQAPDHKVHINNVVLSQPILQPHFYFYSGDTLHVLELNVSIQYFQFVIIDRIWVIKIVIYKSI